MRWVVNFTLPTPGGRGGGKSAIILWTASWVFGSKRLKLEERRRLLLLLGIGKIHWSFSLLPYHYASCASSGPSTRSAKYVWKPERTGHLSVLNQKLLCVGADGIELPQGQEVDMAMTLTSVNMKSVNRFIVRHWPLAFISYQWPGRE